MWRLTLCLYMFASDASTQMANQVWNMAKIVPTSQCICQVGAIFFLTFFYVPPLAQRACSMQESSFYLNLLFWLASCIKFNFPHTSRKINVLKERKVHSTKCFWPNFMDNFLKVIKQTNIIIKLHILFVFVSLFRKYFALYIIHILL